MVDPKWRDGAYSNDDPPRAGIGVGLQVESVVRWSAAGFEDGPSPEGMRRREPPRAGRVDQRSSAIDMTALR